jgi:hypothetical protein
MHSGHSDGEIRFDIEARECSLIQNVHSNDFTMQRTRPLKSRPGTQNSTRSNGVIDAGYARHSLQRSFTEHSKILFQRADGTRTSV